MRFLWVIIFSFCFLIDAGAQEEEVKNWDLTGYVKNLQSIYRINLFGTAELAQDNLLHNRLNFKYYPSEKLTVKAEVRNRIFYGDRSLFQQNFDENAGNDFLDLSTNLINGDGLLFHTMIDRLYLEYVSGDWEIRFGRQRVNWGINTIWNPNDIFNAFNFADFDYQERPGSDALRITKYTGPTSSIELAIKAASSFDDMVIGGLWKFNKGNYDYQLMTGFVQNDLVIGLGWAGNIKNASLKGEASYFTPLIDSNEAAFALTAAIDYNFNSGIYINMGFLYNSQGVTTGGLESLFTSEISAKNLYPFQYAILTQITVPMSPLFNLGLANIYSPSESKALFVNPTLSYSISESWDIDFVGQLMFNETQDSYQSLIQGFFLRFQFSF